MFCPQCGENLQPDAKFCYKCGAQISPVNAGNPGTQSSPASTQAGYQKPGRGGVILTLGILSIVMFGPLTGIPAWIMGHHDLREIRAGLISQGEYSLTTAGMVLGIIGTCIGAIVMLGIIIAIGVAMLGISHEFSMIIRSLPPVHRLG
jgi:hypothetical protein